MFEKKNMDVETYSQSFQWVILNTSVTEFFK